MEEELIKAINYALNLEPLWMPKKPDINTCSKDELQKYLDIGTMRERLLKTQEKYYEKISNQPPNTPTP